MECFDSFKWPVPKAFILALYNAEFTCGDIFYDSLKAYNTNWGRWKEAIGSSINVVSNIKTDPTSFKKGFIDNWVSHIKICYKVYKNGEIIKSDIDTYHGNLFMYLHKGNYSLLLRSNPVATPLMQTEVHKRIMLVEQPKSKEHQFIKIYNESSIEQINNLKLLKLELALDTSYTDFYAYNHEPFEGLSILPTLKVAIFDTNYAADTIIEKVKKVYYKPATSKSQQNLKKTEFFNINKHGLLR